MPRHVAQRGSRREHAFFEADDYRLYRRLVAMAARRARCETSSKLEALNHALAAIPPERVRMYSDNLMPISAISLFFLSNSDYRTPAALIECGAVAQTTRVELSGCSHSPKRGTA